MKTDERYLLELKNRGLKSSIAARRRLTKQPFWKDFQMQFYVIPQETELRELQAQLDAMDALAGSPNPQPMEAPPLLA